MQIRSIRLKKDFKEVFKVYDSKSPTSQYGKLINFYKVLHSEGYDQLRGDKTVRKSGAETFPGKKTLDYKGFVRSVCLMNNCRSLLDYGAGKGGHYDEAQVFVDSDGKEINGLKSYWGLNSVTTWEPGIDSVSPKGKHDIVICVDVLEHCFVGDIFWIIDQLFNSANTVVFANVACYPAQAILPNGDNVHTLVRSPDWWRGVFDAVSSQHHGIQFYLLCAQVSKGNVKTHKLYSRHKISPIDNDVDVSFSTQ